MLKKSLLIILALIITLIILIINPLSSLLLKSALESKLEQAFNAKIDLAGFNFQIFKGIEVDSINFYKKNFELTAGKTVLKPVHISFINREFVIDCSIENIALYNKRNNLSLILDLLSKNSNSSSLNRLNFKRGKAKITIKKRLISFENIEAVGQKAKVYGNIIRNNKSTDYKLDLYLPVGLTENMSGLTKTLLNINTQGDWSKFNIDISILNKNDGRY